MYAQYNPAIRGTEAKGKKHNWSKCAEKKKNNSPDWSGFEKKISDWSECFRTSQRKRAECAQDMQNHSNTISTLPHSCNTYISQLLYTTSIKKIKQLSSTSTHSSLTWRSQLKKGRKSERKREINETEHPN